MKVGFIGLGIMGKPMCKNILKAGHTVYFYSRHEDVCAELQSLGGISKSSSCEVAKESEVVITMVPNSPQVREVILGKGGIIESQNKGLVVIDMSSIDPVESQAIGKELEKVGMELVDAPVSGGEPKAIDGTLSVMAGGKEETIEKYRELLMTMASSVVRCGDLGAGNVAKLANQIVVACNIASMSEALAFSKKMGADPELIYKAIRGGLAGSTVLDAKAPMVLNRNFKPGFRIELHIKDLTNALNAAHAINGYVPLTGQVMEMMQVLKNDGCGSDDHSALAKYYEKACNVTIE
ncbi:MAG: 2-hydroxy-3-oxopropionate reductase [Sphaerochaetaceae bacterium]|nr:2-hydroxy-3-oxopropionate reductase [Sphaerochaetaceae bacterium]